MLKADFHTHAEMDEVDKYLKYTTRELIAHAAKLGYEVLCITNHDLWNYSAALKEYAAGKNILLIPGSELTVQGKHVVAINITQDLVPKIKDFVSLERYKKENIFFMAAHPYFPHHNSLHGRLLRNIHLIDGIEYSHFYLKHINFNRKAERIAKEHHKPLIGTSDCHHLWQMGHTYTMLDCKKDVDSVLEALRKNQLKLHTEPFPTKKIFSVLHWMVTR